MPVHAVYDVLSDPPREAESPFELAARRMIDTWLETGSIVATPDDLRLATGFLHQFGVRLEPLPGCEVRVMSEQDGIAVVSREEAVMTAIRRLVAFEAERSAGRSIARAA
jgi:hypothetical protein